MDKQAMKQHGAFSWNELMTNDLAGSKAFYSELFGWEMDDDSSAGMPYTLMKIEGQEVGGMMENPPEAKGAPSAWGSYVTVDDVDKQVARVKELGGTLIMPPREIPMVGRFAVISDPQGAMLTIITYSDC